MSIDSMNRIVTPRQQRRAELGMLAVDTLRRMDQRRRERHRPTPRLRPRSYHEGKLLVPPRPEPHPQLQPYVIYIDARQRNLEPPVGLYTPW